MFDPLTENIENPVKERHVKVLTNHKYYPPLMCHKHFQLQSICKEIQTTVLTENTVSIYVQLLSNKTGNKHFHPLKWHNIFTGLPPTFFEIVFWHFAFIGEFGGEEADRKQERKGYDTQHRQPFDY